MKCVVYKGQDGTPSVTVEAEVGEAPQEVAGAYLAVTKILEKKKEEKK